MSASAGRGIVLEQLCRLHHRAGAARLAQAFERTRPRGSREPQHGAGNLIIGGGARKLLNADFTYNVASWEPEVRYSSTGTQGELTIRQPEGPRPDR